MHRLNGVIQNPSAAAFDLGDRGLTLGDGLFETIAVFGGKPALLDRHLDRMTAAAAEIRLPVDRDLLEREVAALAGAGGDLVIRLTVTRGAGARGLAIPEGGAATVIASSSPYPSSAMFAPVSLATALVRRNPSSFASRAKTLSYLDNVLAYDAARLAGANDALMLNVSGRVACTSMANLFMVNKNLIVTPPIEEGVLPGVVRALVLELAPSLGLHPSERAMTPEEFAAADATFATNSVRLLTPVNAIDGEEKTGRRLGEAVIQRVAAAVAEACGATLQC
ncbi:MAG TPA: aminotransferase class IV [Hansschlegelia sp.]